MLCLQFTEENRQVQGKFTDYLSRITRVAVVMPASSVTSKSSGVIVSKVMRIFPFSSFTISSPDMSRKRANHPKTVSEFLSPDFLESYPDFR